MARMSELETSSAFLFLLLLAIKVPCVVNDDEQCVKQDACSCKFNNGSSIDLKPATDQLIDDRFEANHYNNSEKFYYNPCRNIVVPKANCTNVAACVIVNNMNQISLGHVSDSDFQVNKTTGQLHIEYKSKNGTFDVKLICSDKEDSVLTWNNETDSPEVQYSLTLTSKCNCLDKCVTHKPHSTHSGISTGAILIIILAVFVSVYFIGGMIFLHFFRGATGTEMIPHYDFWVDLPALIKDGILFTLNGCKPEASYDRI